MRLVMRVVCGPWNWILPCLHQLHTKYLPIVKVNIIKMHSDLDMGQPCPRWMYPPFRLQRLQTVTMETHRPRSNPPIPVIPDPDLRCWRVWRLSLCFVCRSTFLLGRRATIQRDSTARHVHIRYLTSRCKLTSWDGITFQRSRLAIQLQRVYHDPNFEYTSVMQSLIN